MTIFSLRNPTLRPLRRNFRGNPYYTLRQKTKHKAFLRARKMKYVFVWVDNETKKLSWEWLQAKQLLVIFNLLTLSRRFQCRGGRQGWPTRWGRHTCSHSYRVEYQRSSDHTSPLPRPVWPPCYGVVCMTEVSLVSSSWVYLAQPGLANNFCKLSNMSAVCCPAIFWLKLTSNTGDTNEILLTNPATENYTDDSVLIGCVASN